MNGHGVQHSMRFTHVKFYVVMSCNDRRVGNKDNAVFDALHVEPGRKKTARAERLIN